MTVGRRFGNYGPGSRAVQIASLCGEGALRDFVGYCRILLSGRERRHFDLAGQQRAIADYVGANGRACAEFIETERSGAGPWPRLADALSFCRKSGSTLVIGRMGLAQRDPSFLSLIKEARAPFLALDAPLVNEHTLELLLIEAEKRALKSARIRSALAGRVEHGGAKVSGEARESSAASRRLMADKHREFLITTILKLQQDGAGSNGELAEKLNAMGIPRARGGSWTSVTVSRITSQIDQRGARGT